MTKYLNRVDYLKKHMTVKGECQAWCVDTPKTSHKGAFMCNVCFWRSAFQGSPSGIQKNPETDTIPLCSTCIKDNESFDVELIKHKSKTGVLLFYPKCVKDCLWWDWFDDRRKHSAENANIKFQYRRHYSKKDR